MRAADVEAGPPPDLTPSIRPATSIARIESVTSSVFADVEQSLSDLLRACVDGGASVGFLAPLSDEEAIGYWRSVRPAIEAGSRILLVARDHGGRVVGTGQLVFEPRPNGRHRAEVSKVMIHPAQRHRGIASTLVAELEDRARREGITLLVLDTSEGPGGARALYEKLGYTYAGGIPGFALDPDGTPANNAIFFKRLS